MRIFYVAALSTGLCGIGTTSGEEAGRRDPHGAILESKAVKGFDIGPYFEFLLIPGGEKLVFHEVEMDGDDEGKWRDRVVLWDVEDAKVERVLSEKIGLVPDRYFDFSPDQNAVYYYDSATAEEPVGVDLETGKPAVPDPAWEKEAVAWDVEVGRAGIALERVETAWELGESAESRSLILERGEGRNGTHRLLVWSPKAGIEGVLIETGENFYPLVSEDGKRAMVMRQQEDGKVVWTAIEEWDLIKRKMLKTIRLENAERLTTGDLQATGDLRYIFMQGYMVQQVVVFDTVAGAFLNLVFPPVFRFGITGDGRRMAALHGDWEQGALENPRLVIYDLDLEKGGGRMEPPE